MQPSARATSALRAMMRGERTLIAAVLIALTALCWVYLALLAQAMNAMELGDSSPYMWLMPMGAWGVVQFALCFAMWAVMMIAMMLPSAAPMLFTFDALNRSRIGGGAATRRLTAFFLGYVVVWSSFSFVAAGVQWWLHEIAVITDMMTSASRLFDGVLLLVAGTYQFMPAKMRCLSKCRSPMGFLLTEWRDSARGAFVMGLRHGAFCVGCCWALMVLLFVGGVMNLLWIALIAALVLIEKLLPVGAAIARAGGLAMCAGGLWFLFFA